jgi:uroporphyrinogen-III synthase
MDLPSGPAVVLTREAEDNHEIKAALEAQEVVVVEIPCIATKYQLATKLPGIDFDAVAFTSRRGVRGMLQQDLVSSILGDNPDRPPIIGVVGEATADELQKADIQPKIVASMPQGKILAEELCNILPPKSKVAIVRGNLNIGGFDQVIKQAGHELVTIEVYQNITPKIPIFQPFQVAAVFVASPSAARRLIERNAWFIDCPFFAIGPTTAKRLVEHGVVKVTELNTDQKGWIDALYHAYHQAKKPAEEI